MLHSKELHAFHIGAISTTFLNSGCHHGHCISSEVRASQRSATGHCIHWSATVKAMELELWIVGLAKHIRPYEIMQSWHKVSWITAHWNTRTFTDLQICMKEGHCRIEPAFGHSAPVFSCMVLQVWYTLRRLASHFVFGCNVTLMCNAGQCLEMVPHGL